MNYLDIEKRGRDKIKEYRNVALFGAGSYLKEVLESFRSYKIVAIFDNGVKEDEVRAENNIPILNPKYHLNEYVDKDTAVVMSVCSFQYEIAVDLIQNYHLDPNQIFSMCADYQEERIYHAEDILNHVDELEQARSIFYDEESRQYLDRMIKFKFTHDPLCLKPNPHIVGKYMYQEADGNTIMAKKGNHIIDGGAFIGDSAEYFFALTEGDCQLYCFEPFIGNYKILDKTICEKNRKDKVKIYNYALGDKDTTIKVSADNDISARANKDANEITENYITQKKLDSLANEFDRIDFIKLDVEGDEKNVLLGAKDLIKKYSPRMMVSAYHKTEDLWELPLLLHKLNPEYRIYLGHQPHAAFEPEIYVG